MKKLLYYLSAGVLYSGGEKTVRKLRCVMDVFSENKNNIEVCWYIDPYMDEFLTHVSRDVRREMEQIFDTCEISVVKTNLPVDTKDHEPYPHVRPKLTDTERELIDTCDAYYGDGSFIAQCFREAGKPVMLQNIDIVD